MCGETETLEETRETRETVETTGDACKYKSVYGSDGRRLKRLWKPLEKRANTKLCGETERDRSRLKRLLRLWRWEIHVHVHANTKWFGETERPKETKETVETVER